MVLLIFFLLSLPIFILSLVRNHKNKPKLRTPPGPKGLPLIGNLHQLDDTILHRQLWQLSKKYGQLMSLRLGRVPVLIVSSANMAKEVMKTHDLKFCSRPRVLGQQTMSYNGCDLAFAPYNDYWREMRKICMVHLFNSSRVQAFRPIREYEVAQMIEKISTLAVANSNPINLSEAMISLTSTIICRVAFGKRYKEESTERRKFQAMFHKTQGLFTSFFFSDYFPLFGFLDHFTGLLHHLEKKFKEFDIFYEELIKEHLDPSRPKPDHEDILDVLLQIWKSRNSAEVQINFDHIKAILMDVIVAGTESSAATTVWAMTLLIRNPSAMKRAQEEVRNVVGQKGFVDEDDIQKLSYLKAAIKETMRIQPTAGLIARESTQNCNLDGFEIPAKTVVYINLWAIGRDPKIWKNPGKFIPERFVGNPIDLKGQDFELTPFGAGRRICPGMFTALTVVALALANLLHNFDWEIPIGMKKENINMEALSGITMHKKISLSLVPKRYI